MLRFASLASGSRGNSLVVESGSTRVLLDCGLSASETARRLRRLQVEPESPAAVVLTHEHDDHAGGAFAFAGAQRLPVWLTQGTLGALRAAGRVLPDVEIRILSGGVPLALDGLELRPFTVPHDAREPVQFVFSDGARRLGVLSDLGTPTPHVVEQLDGCAALVLECNHDAELLRNGPYPGWLKQRIAGPFGHLENAAAARLLAALDPATLRHVVAAHLSERNNRPELARAALAAVLGCEENWIGVATQEEGFAWRSLD